MSEFKELMSKGEYFKGSEFEETQTVKYISAKRIQANDPKYGDDNGETVEWTFKQEGEEERKFNNHSNGLLLAFDEADVKSGDIIAITRTGQSFDTKWTVVKKDDGIPF